jgi:hypothetical protein
MKAQRRTHDHNDVVFIRFHREYLQLLLLAALCEEQQRLCMNSTGHFSRVFPSRIDGADRPFLVYSTHKGINYLNGT